MTHINAWHLEQQQGGSEADDFSTGRRRLTFTGVSYFISDNDLTGSIPLQANFKVLMCSGNMFEGTIPPLPEVRSLESALLHAILRNPSVLQV